MTPDPTLRELRWIGRDIAPSFGSRTQPFVRLNIVRAPRALLPADFRRQTCKLFISFRFTGFNPFAESKQ